MAPVDEPTLRNLLEDVRAGVLSADDAVARLRRLPFADLGFARVDHHRALRQGFGEAVYGPGKTPEQCAAIVQELLAEGGSPVILTRADPAQAAAAMATNPGCVRTATTLVWRSRLLRPGRVLVLTVGTADLPVAAECVATLRGHGFDPVLVSDVGVAGVHRLLATADELAAADAVVVVAGMEGALASLVGLDAGAGGGRPHQRGLRGVAARGDGAAGHVVVVRVGPDGGRHRQRVRRRVRRRPPAAGMTRTAWFHCFSGIAGDMALGSLVDAGADLAEVIGLLERLPVTGWSLEAEPVLRAGVAATKVHVRCQDTAVVRTYAHISGLIDEARLPMRVRDRAQAVFVGLAEVEGRLHRRPPEQVHFHEVGGLDAIVDVVGTCAASRGARGRPGDGEPGGDGDGHGPQRPRDAPRPGPGGPGTAAGGRRPTGGRSRWS